MGWTLEQIEAAKDFIRSGAEGWVGFAPGEPTNEDGRQLLDAGWRPHDVRQRRPDNRWTAAELVTEYVAAAAKMMTLKQAMWERLSGVAQRAGTLDMVATEESEVYAAFCREHPTLWEQVHDEMYKTYRKLMQAGKI